ncbi:WhiB family transcriptional regulator [Kitasatospora sp. NBC_00240]|uniref:WhiB family transcriptional regulator n=1 Tax=Kitasatospora sp. NBC_00240 TaxID=2903567 RepID=UPI002259C7E9|nr:WhiB family transcriptional regulator [Kitasatospora sp. NBC_00240]MCX5216185.1 WhiB family transcriptional regulator [Kitasatospora sp. NBC_00240]
MTARAHSTATTGRAHRPLDETTATQIADYVAKDPVDDLIAAGYLAGHDGNLVARQLRRPQLLQALEHSVCNAVEPDLNDFYREDLEPAVDWHGRRTQTVRDHCAVCPVRAACTELALRDRDRHGIRGGLPEEKLAIRLKTDADRLEAARDADTRAARTQAERVKAAVDVQRIAIMHLGSAPAATRAANNAAVRAAVQRRHELLTQHRLETGWAAAA